MLVGAEPERLDGRHAELAGAAHVLVEAVADESVSSGSTWRASSATRKIAGSGLRLPTSDENTAKSSAPRGHPLQIGLQDRAGVERVRNEPELETAVSQRVEQRVRGRAEHERRRPGGVLDLQVAHQLLVRDLDPEMPEQLADQTRVLDLLDRARRPNGS